MLKSTPKKASTYTHQYPTDPVEILEAEFRGPRPPVTLTDG